MQTTDEISGAHLGKHISSPSFPHGCGYLRSSRLYAKAVSSSKRAHFFGRSLPGTLAASSLTYGRTHAIVCNIP
jgi:hypothetical protein